MAGDVSEITGLGKVVSVGGGSGFPWLARLGVRCQILSGVPGDPPF
jgi:hypothetical protein